MRFRKGEEYKTETHRKCSKCRQWKKHGEYRERSGRCRDCEREENRNRYRTMDGERLDRHIAKAVERMRKYRKRQTEKRMREAESAMKAFQHHGLTFRQMQDLTGINRRNLSRIAKGDVLFVRKKTVDALYAGLEKHIGKSP